MNTDKLIEKLMKYCDIGDCWEWTGYKDRKGYGQVRFDGKTKWAHRAVWEVLVGPIPAGLQIDHLCRNPACVNPDHLEPVTSAENTRRGIGGGMAGKRMRDKTHCPSGHEYSGENLCIAPDGRRYCRECKRLRSARRYAAARLKAQETAPDGS